MTEDPEVIKYFVNVGIEIPACVNIMNKERAEIWMGPVQISEELHKKIIKMIKEGRKKNV